MKGENNQFFRLKDDSMQSQEWMDNMEYLYVRSFNELQQIFRQEFKFSKHFENMVIELNENLIEYKFL